MWKDKHDRTLAPSGSSASRFFGCPVETYPTCCKSVFSPITPSASSFYGLTLKHCWCHIYRLFKNLNTVEMQNILLLVVYGQPIKFKI